MFVGLLIWMSREKHLTAALCYVPFYRANIHRAFGETSCKSIYQNVYAAVYIYLSARENVYIIGLSTTPVIFRDIAQMFCAKRMKLNGI